MRRLETDNPGWAAQIAVRSAGLVLLGLCAAVAWWLHRAVTQNPQGLTLLEFLAAALAVMSGCLGWALLGEGPGLFRMVPVPGRSILPFSN